MNGSSFFLLRPVIHCTKLYDKCHVSEAVNTRPQALEKKYSQRYDIFSYVTFISLGEDVKLSHLTFTSGDGLVC